MFTELEKRIRRKLKHTARFYPVDLHCHSPMSPCFGRKDGVREGDVNASAEEFAIAACKRSLFIIAVTDHHRCENAEEIAAAADQIRSEGQNLYPNNNLLVLPGMEIAVEENAKTVHVLAIFSENTHPYQIMPILEDTGVETDPEHRTPDSKVTNQRLTTIIRRIRSQGGLAILAHVNSSNGYRQEMRDVGITDEEILVNIQGLSVSAVEISKPEDLQHFYGEDRQIPCVIGSDAHYLDEVGGKEFITRVKMTAPCFSDLERALQDPETRIRFQDPSVTEIKRVHGISLEGGFLDGQIVGFTSNLNCLIGGRGSGKSTLIEAIRYLFEQEIPENRRRDIGNLRDAVLGGCTATLVFEDQLGELYVLQRTYGESQTKIMALDGSSRDDIEISLSENLGVSVYGWSEIEGIAQDTSQQLELIDSFVEEITELKTAEEVALGELEGNAREIKTAITTIEREATQVGNIAELRQELTKLGKEQTEEEQQKAKVDNETELLEAIEARFTGIHEQIEVIEEAIQQLNKHYEEQVARGLKLDEYLSEEVRKTRETEGPLTPQDLERVLTKSSVLESYWERHPELPNAWILRWDQEEIAATFDREMFDLHPETLQFLTYGNPVLERLLQRVPPIKGHQKADIPLMRCSLNKPEPLVAYYTFSGNKAKPVNTLSKLESLLDTSPANGGPDTTSEAMAKAQFETILEERQRQAQEKQETTYRAKLLALEEKGRRLLVKAALCAIQRAHQATLFDQSVIGSDFDEETVQRLRQKGFPFAPLFRLVDTKGLKPEPTDSFWFKLQGKSEKEIKGLEESLRREVNDLLDALTQISKPSSETHEPLSFSMQRFYLDKYAKER